MKIRRAWKYKLELTPHQEGTLSSWLSGLRWLYNLANEQRVLNYRQFRKNLGYFDQSAELPKLKKECPFLAEIPHCCLQQKLRDLDAAYKSFFKQGRGFPNFKKRGQGESARFPDGKGTPVSYRKGKRTSFVRIPRLGLIKFISSQPILGTIKNCTITRRAGSYYISFQTEYEAVILKNKKNPVGIDMGVTNFVTTSNGTHIEAPTERIKRLEKKLAREQRKLSRKEKGSKNKDKQRARVAKLHLKISNIRKDAIHKTTSQLVKNHGTVVVENLDIKSMAASAAGTVESPGTSVAQKRGLNRAIMRQGWFEFKRQLSYKLEWSGGELIKVAPRYTSQACSECGHVEKSNRNKEKFACTLCGYKDHADINAAKNILALGHSASVCGETSAGPAAKTAGRRVSRKQKPTGA